MTDALTGLRTHRDDLRGAILSHGPVCCLVDIDSLRWVNAESGHVEGDRVLAVVASYLAKLAEKHDASVFRVGGDEFLMLLPSLDALAVRDVAAGIVSGVHALEIPYRRTDRPLRTTLEVNVAILEASAAFAECAFSEIGITDAVRNWVHEATVPEKSRSGCEAGVIADLSNARDCPWGGSGGTASDPDGPTAER